MGMRRRLLSEFGLVMPRPGEPRSEWSLVTAPGADTPLALLGRAQLFAAAPLVLFAAGAVFTSGGVFSRLWYVGLVVLMSMHLGRIGALRDSARARESAAEQGSPPAS
jgi:hypothetical protein